MSQIQVELQEWMGSDKSIAEAAWTSSMTLQRKETRSEYDIDRVVKMLIESKHASPIESIVMRFWIKMPIQTDRQHMTHRVASHNGMSGRYRTMPTEWFDIPEDIKEILEVHPGWNWEKEYNDLCKANNVWYLKVLEQAKICDKDGCFTDNEYKRIREFFRGVLPQNNMTERVTVMNLRSFANYQKLRNSEHAQPEIQQVAKLMLKEVVNKNVAPIAIGALIENNWSI